MKHINIPLEDEEYKQLNDKRKNRTWKEFIMLLINWSDEPELKGGN